MSTGSGTLTVVILIPATKNTRGGQLRGACGNIGSDLTNILTLGHGYGAKRTKLCSALIPILNTTVRKFCTKIPVMKDFMIFQSNLQ